MFDYVRWRGDLSFAESGWNEIDSVIAALISYANFGENELSFGNGLGLRLGSLATSELLDRCPQDGIADTAEIRNCFLREMAESRRRQELRMPAGKRKRSRTTRSIPVRYPLSSLWQRQPFPVSFPSCSMPSSKSMWAAC